MRIRVHSTADDGLDASMLPVALRMTHECPDRGSGMLAEAISASPGSYSDCHWPSAKRNAHRSLQKSVHKFARPIVASHQFGSSREHLIAQRKRFHTP